MNEDFKTWTVRSRFKIGDVVYLKICDDPKRGMVTGVIVREGARIIYLVSWPNCNECSHNDCELSSEFIPSFEKS